MAARCSWQRKTHGANPTQINSQPRTTQPLWRCVANYRRQVKPTVKIRQSGSSNYGNSLGRLRYNMRKVRVDHKILLKNNEESKRGDNWGGGKEVTQQGQSYPLKTQQTTSEAGRDEHLECFSFFFRLKMNSFSTVTPKTQLNWLRSFCDPWNVTASHCKSGVNLKHIYNHLASEI